MAKCHIGHTDMFFEYGQTLKYKKAETMVTLHSNSHYSDYKIRVRVLRLV